jgi:hypothetical protein
MKNLKIASVLIFATIGVVIPTWATATPVSSSISKSDAPFFISLWSIQKPENSRDKYLCDAVVIDRNYAVGSATCLQKYDWPLVGVIGASVRGDRGSVFPIWTWMWTDEHGDGSKNHDFALIYAPHGIAPWAYEYNQTMPTIGYPTNSNLEMISWATSKIDAKLQSIPMKLIGKLPSKSSTKAADNLFSATSVSTSSKKNPLNCQSASGSPLISRTSGKVVLVGIVSGGDGKCDPTKPRKFVLVPKFKNFIERNKTVLANGLLRDRGGMVLSDLYLSIFSPKSEAVIPAKIGDSGSTSAIWTSNDPEIVGADIWSIGFNVWKSGWNEVNIGLREEFDGCSLAKNSTVGIQMSKNSKQNVDFAFEVKERSECWIVGKNYKYVESKNSKNDQATNCAVTLYPYGKNFSSDPLAKIQYLSFYLNPACLGTRESIWIRAYLNNGPENFNTNIEPFYDGWFGPWKPTIF